MFHLLQKLKIAFLTKVVPELKLQINRSAPFRNNSKYCKKKKKKRQPTRFASWRIFTSWISLLRAHYLRHPLLSERN